MIPIIGDLWSEIGTADLILVTTNSTVTKSHKLVMGRGAAKEALEQPFFIDTFSSAPEIKVDEWAGRFIEENALTKYGVIVTPYKRVYLSEVINTKLGLFQVKYHWREPADVNLIWFSTVELIKIAGGYNRIAMNYPGIGNGRLNEAVVAPMIQRLPDNVFIYKKAE